MNIQGDELHPNWRALATIHLPLKRFIKAGDENHISQNQEKKYELNGAEVKDFYKNLVTEDLSSNRKQNVPKHKITKKERKKVSTQILDFDKKRFFRCAQENDIKTLQRFKLSANDINICDQFGWSALMIAACEGALEAVQVLLTLGADRNIQDKTGKTALSLARQKDFSEIVKMLENGPNMQTNSCLELPARSEKGVPPNSFYCDICKLNFVDTTLKAHQTSTVHQFNLKPSVPPNRLQRFNISNKNRGLQLMVKQGWDQESGLGPSNSGRLYPVKTVIRKERTGLGIEQDVPRVTHFKPFDERAVKRRKSEYYKKKSRNRNDMRREKVRDWKRDKRLRHELS